MGCGQLENINWILKRKREIGNLYYKKLKDNKEILLQKNKTSYAKNIYWVFGILLKKNSSFNREKIMKKLYKYKIETRPFFLSMNKQKIFRKLKLFKKSKMPNSEYLSKNGFYIPSGLGLKNYQINYIANTLQKILN